MIQWPHGTRAALSLTFDDARPSQIEHGFPVLGRNELRATFYVTIGAMKQNLDAWKRCADAGHEIGNHSLTHPCSGNFEFSRKNALEDYTLDRIARDIDDAEAQIHQLLGRHTTTFAYPCGQKFVGRGEQLQSYVPLVARRFKVGRGFRDEMPNVPGFFDPAQTLGVDMDTRTLADLKPALDVTLAQSAWLVLAGHDVGPEPSRQVTLLKTIDDLAKFASENGIWIDTVDAVASHILSQRTSTC